MHCELKTEFLNVEVGGTHCTHSLKLYKVKAVRVHLRCSILANWPHHLKLAPRVAVTVWFALVFLSYIKIRHSLVPYSSLCSCSTHFAEFPVLSSTGHVARMDEERGVYRVLVGKPEGRRPLGRPRRRWVDNIRMDLQEVGCGYVDWIWLAQDRDRWRTLVSAVMNLRVP